MSLPYACEAMVKFLMAASATLAAYDIRHHGEDGAGSAECITLKGEQGKERLDGFVNPHAYDVTVKATFSTGVLNLADADAIMAAMITSVYHSAVSQAALDAQGVVVGLNYFCLEDEMQMSRIDGRKIRKRIVIFPFIARSA